MFAVFRENGLSFNQQVSPTPLRNFEDATGDFITNLLTNRSGLEIWHQWITREIC
jgi:hypothetical protein